jgi:hypothetical protein
MNSGKWRENVEKLPFVLYGALTHGRHNTGSKKRFKGGPSGWMT